MATAALAVTPTFLASGWRQGRRRMQPVHLKRNYPEVSQTLLPQLSQMAAPTSKGGRNVGFQLGALCAAEYQASVNLKEKKRVDIWQLIIWGLGKGETTIQPNCLYYGIYIYHC